LPPELLPVPPELLPELLDAVPELLPELPLEQPPELLFWHWLEQLLSRHISRLVAADWHEEFSSLTQLCDSAAQAL
jgi:hypothetical protein